MIAVYYDTAYLLKLYRPEPGSEAVRAHAATVDVITCSLHGRVEIVAAAHRKIRAKASTRRRPFVRHLAMACRDRGPSFVG